MSGNSSEFSQVGLLNETDARINPATEETLESIAGLVTQAYNYIILTYVATGNGEGEIETATYKTGGAGGTTVATLTITYNSDDKIATVTKT